MVFISFVQRNKLGGCYLLDIFDCDSSFSQKCHPTCSWCVISQWAGSMDLSEPCVPVPPPPWIQVHHMVISPGKIHEDWFLVFLVSCPGESPRCLFVTLLLAYPSFWLWTIVLLPHVLLLMFYCTTLFVDCICRCHCFLVPLLFCIVDVPAAGLSTWCLFSSGFWYRKIELK